MTAAGWGFIAVYALVLLALVKPVGLYLHWVFEGEPERAGRVLVGIERLIYRLLGVKGAAQSWKSYALSMLAFSLASMLLTYAVLRTQHWLPMNPQGFDPLPADLAFNVAVSFATNTNWQAYPGEATLSHLSQMLALGWQNFVSPAVGMAVLFAVARGMTRSRPTDGKTATLGNFWVDLTRCWLYVLLPVSILLSLFLMSQGVVQSMGAAVAAIGLEGTAQSIPVGPAASQVAIRQLGTNGGGFFNANAAHPFENPTALSSFVQMLLILLLPAGLTYSYGRMTGDQRQGWALFCAMAALTAASVFVAYWADAQPNPALAGLGLDQSAGNLEGKEMRFGVAASALWAAATTAASNGSVISLHGSANALAGLAMLFNMLIGEVAFGGVGSGLYGMLMNVMLAVFIAGLMVGRTPEYLGKKIEQREMKLVVIYSLIMPALTLVGVGTALMVPSAREALANAGPHGLSEMLYAYASAAGNNGSAFAGLSANSPWFNTTLGLAMLGGRYLMMIPVLAIAGLMAERRSLPPGLGTFPTNGPLFSLLLVFVVLVVGALTYLPALALGPILTHFVAESGRVF
jgi:K+-transporting ATPase ATPase A chain